MKKSLLVPVFVLAALLVGAPATAAPIAPIQVSSWDAVVPQASGFYDYYNANFMRQEVAVDPVSGKGMDIAIIGKKSIADDYQMIITQPLTGTGAADGTPKTVIENTASASPVEQYSQPSVAFNPSTGGWLACFGDAVVTEVMCQYLDADGTPNGAAFAISDGWTAGSAYQQSSIIWSPKLEKFVVLFSYPNFVGVRIVDASGGTSGSIIALPFYSGTADSLGGSEFAYSEESDTFLATFRGRAANTEQRAPWTWLLDGNGEPQGSAVRLEADTNTQFGTGTVAYNRARNEFDVLASRAAGGSRGEMYLQRFSATDGSKVGSPATKTFTDPSNYPYYRPMIAAHPFADQDLITVTMEGGGTNDVIYNGVYALPFTSASGIGDPQLLDGLNTAAPTGNRPKVVFNTKTCEYLTTYNRNNTTSDYWQLFSARFTQDEPCTYELTAAKAGSGSGTVTSSPAGIDCGATCSAPFTIGSTVTLAATAASGSTFTGWSGACSGTGDCTVSMSEARSVTATFTAATPPTPPSITVRTPRVVGSTIRTRVNVPGSGRITQSGTFGSGGKASGAATRTACRAAAKSAGAAGTYRITCPLTAAARSARRRGAVRVRLTTTFTPSSGAAQSVVRTVVLRSLKPNYTG